MFSALWELQQGCCAICRAPLTETQAHCDHDHDRKIPRGLLCKNCNCAEGFIKQTGLSAADFGQRLQSYLDNPPAKQEGVPR